MSDNILEDTAEYLLSFEHLNLSINQLFAGIEPDAAVDPAIDIATYGDEAPLRTQDRVRPAVELPRVQITFRSRSYRQAFQLALQAYAEFWDPGAFIISGTEYVNFWPLSRPEELPGGPDANGRYTIAFRAMARVKPE